MDTLYFHIPYDLLRRLFYALVLLLIAVFPAFLDCFCMKLQEREEKVKRGDHGLHTPISWLSMMTVPFAGLLLFILLAVLLRDVIVFLGLR